jgi:hypothetical protein
MQLFCFAGGEAMKALTLAACLIIITASIISTCGCTSSNQTASATPNSPSALTQDQLNAAENTMINQGYTVTQHLVANGTGADGSLYYTGQLAKNGSFYDYTIIACNDQTTADTHFSSVVSFMQQMGYGGSYVEATAWAGTMSYNGVPIEAGVTESTNGAPYMVVEFFGAPSATPTPTPAPTVSSTETRNPVLEIVVNERKLEAESLLGHREINNTVTWNGDNRVTLSALTIGSTNQTASEAPLASNETLVAFPTVQGATNYINALDLSNFKLVCATYIKANDLNPVFFDHDPQTFREFLNVTNLFSPSSTSVTVNQYDNIVQILKIWPALQPEPAGPAGA